MKKINISKEYGLVLKHRINNSDLPNYKQLEKLAFSGVVTKKELREYIKKAKNKYSSLLNINNTQSKGATTSLQKDVS